MNFVGVKFIKQGAAPCELLLTYYRITTDHGSILINKREIWVALILNKMEGKVQSLNLNLERPLNSDLLGKPELPHQSRYNNPRWWQ